jgi:hypothetical protein
MKEPRIYTVGGAIPISNAPDDCLARIANSPDWLFHPEPTDPPDSAGIMRGIASGLLRSRAQ